MEDFLGIGGDVSIDGGGTPTALELQDPRLDSADASLGMDVTNKTSFIVQYWQFIKRTRECSRAHREHSRLSYQSLAPY